jgi:hypothetical protein
VLVVLGVMAATVLTGATGQVLAFVLIGLGLVLLTSLIFLEVGLSEDRDRAREETAVSRKRVTGPLSSERLDRPSAGKLDRSRGHRRRLR